MSQVLTKTQISAGGVAFHQQGSQIEVALISVGEECRWQLPKGLVAPGESIEAAAMREVYEEAGIITEMVDEIDKVEYWYYSKDRNVRVRFHKFVHFYLLLYRSGDVRHHDHEVNEARWVEIDRACEMLAFKTEKKVVMRAKEMLSSFSSTW